MTAAMAITAPERARIYESDLLDRIEQERHPVAAYEREAYPLLNDLYREIRRATPRAPRKELTRV